MTVIHVTNELREVMYQYFAEAQASGEGAGVRTSGIYQKCRTAQLFDISEMPNIQKADFETFLTRPQVMNLLGDCGVDALALMDCTDMIYDEKGKGGRGLKFTDFVDVVLNMRGSNPATVKDIKEQMRLLKITTRDYAATTTKNISDQVAKLRMDVINLGVTLKRSFDEDSDVSSVSPAAPNRLKFVADDSDDEEDDTTDAIAQRVATPDLPSFRDAPTRADLPLSFSSSLE